MKDRFVQKMKDLKVFCETRSSRELARDLPDMLVSIAETFDEMCERLNKLDKRLAAIEEIDVNGMKITDIKEINLGGRR